MRIIFFSFLLKNVCCSKVLLMSNHNICFQCLPAEFTLTELGFNDKSTLVGHFVLSLREREKTDSR